MNDEWFSFVEMTELPEELLRNSLLLYETGDAAENCQLEDIPESPPADGSDEETEVESLPLESHIPHTYHQTVKQEIQAYLRHRHLVAERLRARKCHKTLSVRFQNHHHIFLKSNEFAAENKSKPPHVSAFPAYRQTVAGEEAQSILTKLKTHRCARQLHPLESRQKNCLDTFSNSDSPSPAEKLSLLSSEKNKYCLKMVPTPLPDHATNRSRKQSICMHEPKNIGSRFVGIKHSFSAVMTVCHLTETAQLTLYKTADKHFEIQSKKINNRSLNCGFMEMWDE
ncbi:MAG: hypothetical protein A2X80_03780 [Geobacteraceae bacterium GWB2_52_12]|nr:MAG: hypothetical protein A2X80_03780 [Geobacteraceae bacterium GWB2_52_12]